jgi:hypothetical protein
MAQDFYKSFELGLDDKHIGTVDEGGVALAAIQGLYNKNRALERDNAELRRSNEGLRRQNAAQNRRLARLERALAALSGDGR